MGGKAESRQVKAAVLSKGAKCRIAVAVGKSLMICLTLGAAVLGPGLYLVEIAGLQLLGLLWLFCGAFAMMAWSYRKPWRLIWLTCLLPPLAALGCYGIQLWVFGGLAPPNDLLPPFAFLGAAALAGGVLGYYRALAHEIYLEDGAVMARRTLAYLGLWAVAYIATQGLAYLGRSELVQGGLLTGAFTTTMLAVVSLVLLSRRAEALSAAVLLVVCGLLAPSPGRAQVEADPYPDQIIADLLQPYDAEELGTRLTLQQVEPLDPSLAAAYRGQRAERNKGRPFSWARATLNAGDGYDFRGTVFIYYFDLFRWQTPDDAEADLLYMERAEKRDSGPVEELWIGDRAFLAENTCRAGVAQGRWSYYLQLGFSLTYGEARQVCEALVPLLAATIEARLAATALAPDTTGSTPNEWDPAVIKQRAAEAMVLVALVMVASGIVVALANALAGAIAQAVQAAGNVTADEVAAKIMDQAEAAMAESELRLPELIDPFDGEALATNEKGQYQDPYSGTWLTPEEAVHLVNDLAAQRAEQELKREEERRQFAEETRHVAAQMEQKRLLAAARERYDVEQELARRQAQWDSLHRVEAAAVKAGDIDILLRSSDDRIFDAKGDIDTDYLVDLKQALRRRIGREVAAPKETLAHDPFGWLKEGVRASVDDTANSFVARIAMGMGTAGSSEVFFQGYAIGSGIKRAAETAEDAGEKLSRDSALWEGTKELGKQNLPVNTASALARWHKGEQVGGSEMGLSLLGDAMALIGLADDARNVLGALKGAGMTLKNAGQQGVRRTLSDLADDVRYRAPDSVMGILAGKALGPRGMNALQQGARQAAGAARRGLDEVLGKLGLKGGQGGGRLDLATAKSRFAKTELTKRTQALIEEMRVEGAGRLSELDPYFQQGRRLGQQKVENLEKALARYDAARAKGDLSPAQLKALREQVVRPEVLRVQADKHAMNRMNKLPRDAAGENAAIREFNEEMNAIYRETDKRVREALAERYNVKPEDIVPVKITNMKGDPNVKVPLKPGDPDHHGLASRKRADGEVTSKHPLLRDAQSADRRWSQQALDEMAEEAAQAASGKKVSFDRDLTMRLRILDKFGNRIEVDIPSNTLGKVYNDEFFKVATGRPPPKAATGTDFIDVHMSARQHLIDPLEMESADHFAKRMDQATTDRLHAEAYGRGQADLDTATKDAYRGADLTDPGGVAKTMAFKAHHWLNEAHELKRAAAAARDPAERLRLLAQATAHQEEAMRQTVKQYNNMVLTRSEKMVAMGNAPDPKVPVGLSENINVLKGVQEGRYSAPEAEEILKRMGTSSEQVAQQMSAYVEGLQTLRRPSVHWGRSLPAYVPRGFAGELADRDQR